jgi:diphthamide synthase (EF-2-diphthine--ammonia ligase)
MPEQYAFSFSGGKDSMLALDRAVRTGRQVSTLVTMYDAESVRARFHGIPITLIQADALGIPLLRYPMRPETFAAIFLQSLIDLRECGITGIIFGNIHLQDIRALYEERSVAAGLTHLEPL